MSINWVMLSADKKRFTPLPGEQQLWTSSPRTTLSLRAVPGYPGRESLSIESNAGTLYLTNRRILFLPSTPTSNFQSFASPILNLHDTHITVPWFGANIWTAAVQPVPGGNLTNFQSSSSSSANGSSGGNSNPSTSTSISNSVIELKIAFKDGGAFDFHSKFERIKERLVQVVEVARDSGAGAYAATTNDMSNIHLDELPAYEAAAAETSAGAATTAATTVTTSAVAAATGGTGHVRDQTQSQSQVQVQERSMASSVGDDVQSHSHTSSIPSDEPPGYEEVQRSSVAYELERQLQQHQR